MSACCLAIRDLLFVITSPRKKGLSSIFGRGVAHPDFILRRKSSDPCRDTQQGTAARHVRSRRLSPVRANTTRYLVDPICFFPMPAEEEPQVKILQFFSHVRRRAKSSTLPYWYEVFATTCRSSPSTCAPSAHTRLPDALTWAVTEDARNRARVLEWRR